MKKIFVLFILFLFGLPVLAEIKLKPEPQDKSIVKYKELLKVDEFDPADEIVWKLFIHAYVTSDDGSLMPGFTFWGGGYVNNGGSYMLAGLTRKPEYFVILPTNNIQNYISPLPKPGGIIVVKGIIRAHSRPDFIIDINTKAASEFDLKNLKKKADVLAMLPDAAAEMPPEPTKITVVPTIAPTVISKASPAVPASAPKIPSATATQTVDRH
jgi:hypothetical protein